MVIIVKRGGHKEKFDERKIYGSIYAACASANYKELDCEKTANMVTRKIKKPIRNRKQIKSIDIRKKVERELKRKDKRLAFYYEEHLPNLRKL